MSLMLKSFAFLMLVVCISAYPTEQETLAAPVEVLSVDNVAVDDSNVVAVEDDSVTRTKRQFGFGGIGIGIGGFGIGLGGGHGGYGGGYGGDYDDYEGGYGGYGEHGHG